MKTVKAWLEWIPDELMRNKCLANLYNDRKNEPAYSLAHAVFIAFLWSKAPEGYKFWKDYHDTLKS